MDYLLNEGEGSIVDKVSDKVLNLIINGLSSKPAEAQSKLTTPLAISF